MLDLNQRPRDLEALALPTELMKDLCHNVGLEPTSRGLESLALTAMLIGHLIAKFINPFSYYRIVLETQA